jgi:hypothetical protein
MEDVIIQRIAVSCLVIATITFVWFLIDTNNELKSNSAMAKEYSQFLLDRMKVQDLEDRWSNGPD